jgi:hypothetical protein
LEEYIVSIDHRTQKTIVSFIIAKNNPILKGKMRETGWRKKGNGKATCRDWIK